MSRLVLGTVQLGMPYGIANHSGQPSESEAKHILDLAWEFGIRELDTAPVYGQSEALIGKYGSRFDVVSKIAAEIDVTDERAVEDSVNSSVAACGKDLAGVLLRKADHMELLGGSLGHALARLKNEGKVGFVGVSIYSAEEFHRANEIDAVEAIQFPFNAFDTKLARTELIKDAVARGKKLYVRSAFLQGLLLMGPTLASGKFPGASSVFERWAALGNPLVNALACVKELVPQASIIVGCERAEQLKQIGEAFAARVDSVDWEPFQATSDVTDPRTWAQ